MNCFQFIIFAPAKTTIHNSHLTNYELWIAFNLLFSPQRKQLWKSPYSPTSSCELLSIYYFRPSENNPRTVRPRQHLVVNCFQFIIFAPAKTTSLLKHVIMCKLWIAFNLLFSPQRKQHALFFDTKSACCELLSIYYFRPSENNFLSNGYTKTVLWIAFNLLFSPQRKQPANADLVRLLVVNCFQFIIFAPAKTTYCSTSRPSTSCELLSIYYFRPSENNLWELPSTFIKLWIAFNLLFSPQRKQQILHDTDKAVGCELLSIYYFRPSENNIVHDSIIEIVVVNCFQFIIFAPAKTTLSSLSAPWASCELLSIYYFRPSENNFEPHFQIVEMLWIAFNLLFSPQRKQLNPSNQVIDRLIQGF